MINNDRYINRLIPEVISKNINTGITIKKKLKLKSLFADVEDKASDNLMKFVKLSNRRYKGMKSGNGIESIVLKSKQSNNGFVSEIMKNEIYSPNHCNCNSNSIDCNIKEDKKFLKEKIVMRNVKEVNEVIKDIKLFSQSLLPNKKSHRPIHHFYHNQRNLSDDIADKAYKPFTQKQLIHYNSDPSLINNRKEILNTVISNDNMKIHNQLSQYSRGIDSYLQSLPIGRSTPTATSFFKQLSKSNDFSYDNLQLQMLSYRKPIPKKTIIVKRGFNDINLPFSIDYLSNIKALSIKKHPL